MYPDLMGYLRGTLAPCRVRRDRGEDLFVTEADLSPDGWIAERQGRLTFLRPDDALLEELYAMLPASDDFFPRSLERTKGFPPSDEAKKCFLRGLKLSESASQRDIARYEKETREVAALALRTRRGNAWACARMLILLKETNDRKETN